MRRILFVAAALVLAGLGAGAYLVSDAMKVEPLPAQLPPLPVEPVDPSVPLRIAGPPGSAELVVGEPTGKTTFLVIDGQASMRSEEGKTLHRALDRWVFPESTVGYAIGDARGFALFRKQAEPYVAMMAREVRFPLYVDWEGKVADRFPLPQGHTGFVILGPEGDVLFRHGGAIDEAKLAEVQRLLGAEEPPAPPPAPEFRLGSTGTADCAAAGCLIAFFGRTLAATDVERKLAAGGPDAERVLSDPDRRLHGVLARVVLAKGLRGIAIGIGHEVKLPEGFEVLDDAPELREPFGLGAGEVALFAIDRQGRLVVAEKGAFPMYRAGRAAEVLGFETRRDGEAKPSAP